MQQFLLAIARDPGNAEDFARVEVETDVVERGAEGVGGGQGDVADRKDGGARGAALGGAEALELGTDHHARHGGGRFGARVAGAGDLAATEDRGTGAERPDLFELVADIEDGAAIGGELAQGDEERLDRLRGEHRGGLVHDEEARLLEERADDLDALPLAHGHGVDVPGRIDREPVAGGEFGDPRGELGHGRRRGHGEGDVFGDGQRVEEREVLEDHADAEALGIVGALDMDLATVPEDVALVRPHQPIDDLHQRRLAGAVLPDDGVDLARRDAQVDAAIGHHAGVALANAGEFQTPVHTRSAL